MIYRIHFEPKGAYWCLQFQDLLMFWKTVTHTDVLKAGPMKFNNYDEAEKYVVEQGIDKVYYQSNTRQSSPNTDVALEMSEAILNGQPIYITKRLSAQ